MKIKIVKIWKRGIHKELNAGQLAVVAPELGKKLVRQGIAVPDDHMTDKEMHAEVVKAKKAADIISDLPHNARDLKQYIKSMTNIKVLETLLYDERKTVRQAAESRLKELE